MSSGPSNPIRREIRDCALFIPVISANTASRHEGYFRLEWDLADQRMGRRRKRDEHLPQRAYLDHGTYWFRQKQGKLRAAGVSFEDRQDLLGHKNARITTHYSGPELASLIDPTNGLQIVGFARRRYAFTRKHMNPLKLDLCRSGGKTSASRVQCNFSATQLQTRLPALDGRCSRCSKRCIQIWGFRGGSRAIGTDMGFESLKLLLDFVVCGVTHHPRCAVVLK
jgi:hypothetical protein